MGEQSELDAVNYERTDDSSTALAEFDATVPARASNAPGTLQELAWQARALSHAVTLPNALRDKPADILAVMLAGRELGIGPMASTRMVHIISGQTSIATELKLALAHRAGHEIIPWYEGDGYCVVHCATHQGAGATGWAMRREDCVTELDEVLAWTIATDIMVESWGEQRGQKVETPLVAKANWRSYQRDMLFWRAAAQFMRRHCPGLAGGLYTVEELGGDGET